MSLKEYNAKRDFHQTPEPKGKEARSKGNLRFVVQMHAATRLHYDLRLEMGGVFKSWAVPKGPSLNPQEQHLAVFVEDHPLEYGSFEGIIPKGNYGAGTVMLWDQGTYIERGSEARLDSEKAMLKGLEAGHITFVMDGQKLRGEFALIRFKKKGDEKSWLLVKKRDEFATRDDITEQNLSVKTGRSLKEIAADAPAQGAIWHSKQVTHASADTFKPRAKPTKKRPVSEQKPGKATEEKFPRRLKPLLPTSDGSAFDQEGWIFESFADGFRALAEVEKGRVHLYSRQLLSFDRKFPSLVDALRKVPQRLLLDGEIVASKDVDPVFYVFDLLHQDGTNLRDLPLLERKKRLQTLPIFGDAIRFREHVENNGLEAYARAQKEGAPSLLAKDAQSHYRPGTSKFWLKIKVRAVAPTRAQGQVRPPKSFESEAPQVSLTHLDKIFWPKEKRTKGDVIEYYRAMAPWILPHLKDRPQSLNRHPNGIAGDSFYQKDMTGHLPRFVETEKVFSESADKTVNYLVCNNLETLLYMANLGCIELNPWISRVGSLERPDYAIIDLDPDDDNDFEQVMQVAREVRRILNQIGAMSLCKTSGATGLHICVPMGARYEYEQVREFAEKVCRLAHQKFPDFTSLERTPAKRRGKIYLDFLQNRKGQTLAAPYCIRPRPGAPVSTPLEWSELKKGLTPDQFHVGNIRERLEEVGDLWKPLLGASVDLDACLAELNKEIDS